MSRSSRCSARVVFLACAAVVASTTGIAPPSFDVNSAFGSDWPSYRHDAKRTAVSPDVLEFPLNVVWHRKAEHAPEPAFADPVDHPTEFDFAFIRDGSQPVMLKFDHAFHPVAAQERVFFGSSADDTVRCVSLKTGREEWFFVTAGPIRFAPQVVDDRLYVASDDGFVYCLNATSGKLIWKFRAAPTDRQLVGNGRMISRWPLRSGVLVLDGVLYVTAGMWPAEGVYVYALDAETGQVNWVNDTSGIVNQPTVARGAYTIGGVAPTGYLLAGHGALVVSTGRSIPATYSLADGKLLASTAPSYQNRRGGPASSIDPHGSVLFGFSRERLTTATYAIHYAYRLPALTQFGTLRADRVLVDDNTFLTVGDLVRCYKVNSRYTKPTVFWQEPCPSRNTHCLTLSKNTLLLGIDNRIEARDRSTGKIVWQHEQLNGYVRSLAIVDSQVLAATDSGSIYCFGNSTAATSPPTIVEPKTTPSTVIPKQPLVQRKKINRGLALVIGHENTNVAEQLAKTSRLNVVAALGRADAMSTARRNLDGQRRPDQGRVSVQHLAASRTLPYSDYSFNLIVATEATVKQEGLLGELIRLLSPVGGILYVENVSADTIEQTTRLMEKNKDFAFESRRIGTDVVFERGKLPGALDWDSETKTDLRVKWPLELLWFGGPGSKRVGSGSRAPVAAGGRNYVIGKNHVVALDAYNGTELWSRTLPYLYRNIGRLKAAPGPIQPWLTNTVSADDDFTYLNFGHVVYQLDASTGQQVAVHGEIPQAKTHTLGDSLRFTFDHYQKPDLRGTSSTRESSTQPAGNIELTESSDGKSIVAKLRLASNIEIEDRVYWELFFDVRPTERRMNLYDNGIFHFIVKPATGQVTAGVGTVQPTIKTVAEADGRKITLTIPIDELEKIGNTKLDNFAFAAALNHPASAAQKAISGGRLYMRWELNASAHSYAFNNGWPVIVRNPVSQKPAKPLPSISSLPIHATKSGRIGRLGKRAGYVVNIAKERLNPLSLELDGFEFNRGKGCGYPVAGGTLQVLRSGSLAFYDTEDDSGMRYFGGVRPSCTVSAIPSQGLVFAAEGSSGCSCNYNFKATLAMAPARVRRHEDWAVFMAPLSPGALLQTGRFNLAAPGDRRDDTGGLWMQYPRAPTLPNRSMAVPVELIGESLKQYRVNADRVAIAETDRPWLFTSGYEGIEGLRFQLFMSDKEGAVIFPGTAPTLNAKLDEPTWERRYSYRAGNGGLMFLSHDEESIFVGYEIIPPLDRRGKRQPWTVRDNGQLPYQSSFSTGDKAKDEKVWEESSVEFLVSDVSLKTILHFGVGISGGRYDGRWTLAKKTQDPSYTAEWAGSINVTSEKAVAEFALPLKTLADAGLDLENLVIRSRTRLPLTRQPHISHGFRPLLLQGAPQEKHYQVSLYFAELDAVEIGERVFDIEIQGQTVLKDFDPVAAAKGRHKAVVRHFKNIRADRALDVRFVQSENVPEATKRLTPILSSVELVLEK
jgi:outer membrane protein assembly factor BamB